MLRKKKASVVAPAECREVRCSHALCKWTGCQEGLGDHEASCGLRSVRAVGAEGRRAITENTMESANLFPFLNVFTARMYHPIPFSIQSKPNQPKLDWVGLEFSGRLNPTSSIQAHSSQLWSNPDQSNFRPWFIVVNSGSVK